jgi:RNA polymerase sigma factor (sigma-70 family)
MVIPWVKALAGNGPGFSFSRKPIVSRYKAQPHFLQKAIMQIGKVLELAVPSRYSTKQLSIFFLTGACSLLLSERPERMAADSTTQLQGILDRMLAGDLTARDELIARAYGRLQRLTHRMFQDFSRARGFEETGDLLHDSLQRLSRAVESVQPQSVAEFFRLASKQIRWELLDLAQRCKGPVGAVGQEQAANSTSHPPFEPATTTNNPPSVLNWSEFHEAVEALPVRERETFGLLWYHEMTRAEAAAVLNVSEITVRRWWLAARERLGAVLCGGRDE